MNRRQFIALVGGAAAWPLAARAQQPAMPVIGYLSAVAPEAAREFVAAFHRGLVDKGYVEGRNVAIEYRWAEGDNDRLPALGADLIRRQVAVIAAAAVVNYLKVAPTTVPIAFLVGSDPVESGIVGSLSHPGGNLTGVSVLNAEVMTKRVELLHKLLPGLTSIAFFVNPENPILSGAEASEVQLAAQALGLRVVVLNANRGSEIDAAFATLVEQGIGGLLVSSDPILTAARVQIIALAARYKVPTVYQFRGSVEAGGLISYGTDLLHAYRQLGSYTGRILKGEKPADLPVEQITRLELAINLKTAKALGLTVPDKLLALADEVIE